MLKVPLCICGTDRAVESAASRRYKGQQLDCLCSWSSSPPSLKSFVLRLRNRRHSTFAQRTTRLARHPLSLLASLGPSCTSPALSSLSPALPRALPLRPPTSSVAPSTVSLPFTTPPLGRLGLAVTTSTTTTSLSRCRLRRCRAATTVTEWFASPTPKTVTRKLRRSRTPAPAATGAPSTCPPPSSTPCPAVAQAREPSPSPGTGRKLPGDTDQVLSHYGQSVSLPERRAMPTARHCVVTRLLRMRTCEEKM